MTPNAQRLITLIGDHQPREWPCREVINPATGAAFASVAVIPAAHLDAVLADADEAAQANTKRPLVERRQLLRDLAAVIEEEAAGMSELLTLEQGKPLSEATGEVLGAAGLIRSYAEIHPERTDDLFAEDTPTHRRIYKPLGVVAGIIPWNFPFLIAAMKVAPAILTGNAIVVKPSPTTPLTTLALAALAKSILPQGLLQVIGDDGSIGPLLTAHPGVAKIAFTGSTQSGRAVMAAAAAHLTRVTLELGGNDAAIVLADADIPATAKAIASAAFTNAGQICGAIKRVYADAAIIDALADALGREIEALMVQNGLADTARMGPVQNERQYHRAMALRDLAIAQGQLIATAAIPDGPGYFVPPSLFIGLEDDHPLVAEEQFAPLLPLLPFGVEAEAIARANSVPFALTASVWSQDQTRAESVAAQLEAALICVNAHNQCPAGVGLEMAKQSGIGWLLGDEGLKQYLQSYALVRLN
jgi:acyl-CoA reductase-like NAD-dependent aldehyde dehydrogenase